MGSTHLRGHIRICHRPLLHVISQQVYRRLMRADDLDAAVAVEDGREVRKGRLPQSCRRRDRSKRWNALRGRGSGLVDFAFDVLAFVYCSQQHDHR